jgi:non-ribosomal peptide synthetase component F
VERLHGTKEFDDMSLYQVVFNFQKAPPSDWSPSGLKIAPKEIPTVTSRFDMTMFIWDSDDKLTASAVYRTELFDASTIGRMMELFRALLTSIAANPEQRLIDLTYAGHLPSNVQVKR